MSAYLEVSLSGIQFERPNAFYFSNPYEDVDINFRAVFETVVVVDSEVVSRTAARSLEDAYDSADVITLYNPVTEAATGSTTTKGALLLALWSWAHQLRLAADA